MKRVALVLALAFSTSLLAQEPAPRDRAAFVKALASLEPGTSAKDALAKLGKPDDVRTRRDPGGISSTDTKEIWRYGTSGHLTFPTLGQVYVNEKDEVQYVFGGRGSPPAPDVLSEAELQRLLPVLAAAPKVEGWSYDPRRVIAAVNALQPLGKEKALAAISEYLRVSSHFHDPREGMFLVLRVLFDVPTEGFLKRPGLGGPSPADPEDKTKLPRFPILLLEDVPLLVVNGYFLAGLAEQPESHVQLFRETGVLRAKPLAPPAKPHRLLAKALEAVRYEGSGVDGRALLAGQLLGLLATVHPAERGWGPDEEKWREHAAQLDKLAFRWDAARSCYTLRDGSTFEPARAPAASARELWSPEGFKGLSVYLERQSKGTVELGVTWQRPAGTPGRPLVLRVRRADGTELAVVELDAKGRAKASPEGLGLSSMSWGDSVNAASSATVVLPLKREKVTLVAESGDERATSQPLEP